MREALATRFEGLPDVHYGNDEHFVDDAADTGISKWTLTDTTREGTRREVQGCDFYSFRNGKVTRKELNIGRSWTKGPDLAPNGIAGAVRRLLILVRNELSARRSDVCCPGSNGHATSAEALPVEPATRSRHLSFGLILPGKCLCDLMRVVDKEPRDRAERPGL